MDLFGRGKIMLNQCSLLVIDEADRMLDMGFIPDIEEICTKLPSPRQTLLFSATMPPPIKKLADKFMDSPRLIEVARPASTNTSITQYVVETSPRGKREVLRGLLRDPEVRNAIIFCNRKRDIKELVDSLKRGGFAVSQIHGDMDQSDRIKELDRFKSGDINIIVASDVAARGLDIPGVSHVVNYDVPHHAEDYVHRIGRTGRAGRTGIAYTLSTDADAENLAEVEKLIRQKITRYGGPEVAPIAAEDAIEVAPPVVADEAAEPDTASDAPKRRRRGGRGRKRDDAPVAAASVVPPAPRVEPPRPPAPPRAEPRAARAPADPIRSYRGSRDAPRRDDRRNHDDGESFIGFGPEGIPDFLTRKATVSA
jgi:superfamily II DNA/RNA helicase